MTTFNPSFATAIATMAENNIYCFLHGELEGATVNTITLTDRNGQKLLTARVVDPQGADGTVAIVSNGAQPGSVKFTDGVYVTYTDEGEEIARTSLEFSEAVARDPETEDELGKLTLIHFLCWRDVHAKLLLTALAVLASRQE